MCTFIYHGVFILGEIINIIQSEDFVICQAQMIQLSRYIDMIILF